ncbi:hypothetical protein [Janibacter corallicola]|uniref:hypothetical protein n=1 Tax=Janibacter corallicola TaxID=415212 RepID=UPI00083574C2|nr:hypothetical protein [Janibacter corallicola]
MPRTVLVEGVSDRVALTTLAHRRGEALDDVDVVALGGITNIRAVAVSLGPRGAGHHLCGLYDSPAVGIVREGLHQAGLPVERAGLRELGFFGCVLDLEDELVRAVGVDGVEAVIDAEGEGRSLRLLAGMPAQRGWTREAVVRRFLTSQAGRKARYARALTEALDPHRAPGPMEDLLDHLREQAGT